MPSFLAVVSSLLIPAAAVLAGPLITPEPVAIFRREPCKATYSSKNGDTCATIDKAYGLVSGTILAENAFLTCSDIWVGTPICVPDGPYACSETYTSKKGDTCQSIEQAFDLEDGSLLPANTFLTCGDIWENTPICIPDDACPAEPATTTTAPDSTPTPASCKSTYTSSDKDTCESVEQHFNLVSGTIKSANLFVTCNDIWVGTPLCIPDGPYKECTTQTYHSQKNDTWYVLLRASARDTRLTLSTLQRKY
jgi:LysM repeat protein